MALTLLPMKAFLGLTRRFINACMPHRRGYLLSCRAHSKTVGGLPLASDVFLFQKQQTFNRSKNLERMVHPCGSGAFGYFECTKKVDSLTVCLS
jgi:catalase